MLHPSVREHRWMCFFIIFAVIMFKHVAFGGDSQIDRVIGHSCCSMVKNRIDNFER